MTREDLRERAAIAMMTAITPGWTLDAKHFAKRAVEMADALVTELTQIRTCLFCAHCREQKGSSAWDSTYFCSIHQIEVKHRMSCEQWTEQIKPEAR